jgi:hypothetical protein
LIYIFRLSPPPAPGTAENVHYTLIIMLACCAFTFMGQRTIWLSGIGLPFELGKTADPEIAEEAICTSAT